MNNTNTDKLFERFSFFKPESPLSESLMRFGFECGDGWFDLLWELCEKIDEEIKFHNIKDFEVIQVKEKFGSLRFYTRNSTDTIQDLVQEAEMKSATTCENCGSNEAGLVRKNGWLSVLCQNCEANLKDA